jgi:hypothetical protein
MPATLPCPHCQQLLLVRDEYLGRLMSCPRCRQTFTAPAIIAIPEPGPPTPQPLPATETMELPLDLTPFQVEEQITPPPPEQGQFQIQAEPPAPLPPSSFTLKESPRSGNQLDRDREKPPQRRPRPLTRLEPHRGVLILILGVATILLIWCPPLAWVLAGAPLIMSRADLAKMAIGSMDSAGRGLTEAGRTLAMTGFVLSILVMFFVCLLQLTDID